MSDIEKIYSRNELYWGKENQQKLSEEHVAVFGLGGVGAYVAEAFARSGIGRLTLVDFDTVQESNINRQLIALLPDIGKYKTELMAERINQINPNIEVCYINDFYTEKINEMLFDKIKVDFVVDAIDTLKYKTELIISCYNRNIPIIVAMGSGNRIDPTKLYITDISEVKIGKCQFVRNVVSKLKSAGITKNLPVVISDEKPFSLEKVENDNTIETKHGEIISLKKFSPATTPFVSPVAGYIMASYVVRKFLGL